MSLLAGFTVPHPPMIIPEVGRGSEKQIEETIKAYEKIAIEIAELKPDTIIITSPHAIMYADYFNISYGSGAKGSFSEFNAPEVSFSESYDTELIDEITNIADAASFPAGILGDRQKELDHGTMVPLWFIRRFYKEGKIVRIGLSGLPLTEHYRLGKMINEAAEALGRNIVFVASGDLSHKLQEYGPYGYVQEGPEYDKRVMDVLERGAFGELLEFNDAFCEKAAECGHRSFVIMAGAFDGIAVRSGKLSYQDITGVGYGICSFYPEGEDEKRHFLGRFLKKQKEELKEKEEKSDQYVKLARASINSYIINNKTMKVPDDIPEEMKNKKAGAFVSIHKHGKLRGCIGTIFPTTDCVAQEIIDNAISAATRDPRFDPIKEDELEWLEINVDVMGLPEEISGPDELDVKKYGVIVSSGSKKGLLLPDLEGVDTVSQQISIAMQKAGIRQGEDIRLQRFEVIRHT